MKSGALSPCLSMPSTLSAGRQAPSDTYRRIGWTTRPCLARDPRLRSPPREEPCRQPRGSHATSCGCSATWRKILTYETCPVPARVAPRLPGPTFRARSPTPNRAEGRTRRACGQHRRVQFPSGLRTHRPVLLTGADLVNSAVPEVGDKQAVVAVEGHVVHPGRNLGHKRVFSALAGSTRTISPLQVAA